MTDGRPTDLPPELLAAYADGELGARGRARVERWLADHPEARELLDGQDGLGPGNADFWQAASPPEPTPREWAAVLQGIRGRVPPGRRWVSWVGPLAVAATAATVFLALPTGNRPMPASGPGAPAAAPRPTDPDDAPYAMAGPDEVRIISLPEAAAHLLVVGEHPLGDSLVVLARADEVEFFGIGTDPTGRFPEVPAEMAPDDSPMIWAPKDP
jgi:hypothetical protein